MLNDQQTNLINQFNKENKDVKILKLSDLLNIDDLKRSYHLYKNGVKHMTFKELKNGLFIAA